LDSLFKIYQKTTGKVYKKEISVLLDYLRQHHVTKTVSDDSDAVTFTPVSSVTFQPSLKSQTKLPNLSTPSLPQDSASKSLEFERKWSLLQAQNEKTDGRFVARFAQNLGFAVDLPFATAPKLWPL